MAGRRTRKKKPAPQDTRIYELEVCLFGGMVTEKFAKRNPVVSRTIQIRGDQTLERLHEAIFDAFDRFDEHMYEFQVGGKGPMDPKAKRYVLSMALDAQFADRKPAGEVSRTTVGALGLNVDQAFGYWFDFGDDWWHMINVVAVRDEGQRGKYPKVIKRVGQSPPQYIDPDEEDQE